MTVAREEDKNNNAEDWCGNFTPEDIRGLTEEFSQPMEGTSSTQVTANTNKNSRDVPCGLKDLHFNNCTNTSFIFNFYKK